MLRLRLFYGLLTIILLLWAVGAAALLQMRDSVKRLDERLRSDYQVLDATQAVRTLTTTLNTTYLPALAAEPSSKITERTVYDGIQKTIEEKLAIIRLSGNLNAQWHSVIIRLDQVFVRYHEIYETYFAATAITQEDRHNLLESASIQTQRIIDLTENVITLGEAGLFSGAAKLGDDSGKNILFVGTLVFLGTFIAVIIYFHLVRHLVDPVSTLERSIDEIRLGNFEFTLPRSSQTTEFTKVISAFNDMALELKNRRRESDENLSRANLVNSAILEAIPSPVFVLGDDTSIIQINPAAEEFSDKLGAPGRLPLKIQRILEECRETSASFLPEDPREALLFRIEDEEFYYLPRIFRYDSENSIHSGWAILLHNVSRIRWLDDMKTNLLSTVSHEIKTPLTGIRMVLHLLLEERSGPLDEMQRVIITSANEDCERLLATLNAQLDLSRAENGATHLECIPVLLQDSVQRAAQLHASLATSCEVNVRLEDDSGGTKEILADPIRLDEVVNNLVSNAIKHSPRQGEVVLRISQPDANYLRVSVTDQGPGVPDGSQSRIFERFYRAPGQVVDGVGLGLFISREIIRAHEGRIGLLERKDNLTEFYIDVPIA